MRDTREGGIIWNFPAQGSAICAAFAFVLLPMSRFLDREIRPGGACRAGKIAPQIMRLRLLDDAALRLDRADSE
jgi:hypothetical protein